MEFVLEKHKLLPDPNMIGLFEKLAEEILDPAEAFELKRKKLILKVNDIILFNKKYYLFVWINLLRG